MSKTLSKDSETKKPSNKIKTGPRRLKVSDGSGTYMGMEARVAKIESDVSYIKEDIRDVKEDVRDMRKDLADMRKDMDTRFAGVQSQIDAKFSSVQSQFASMQNQMDVKFAGVQNQFTNMQNQMDVKFARMQEQARTDFRLIFGALITTALGLAAMMAKSLGWF